MESPLSKVQLGDLRRATARVADCRIRIDRAKAAGLPMEEQEVRCDQLGLSLQQLLDVYDAQQAAKVKEQRGD